MALSDEIRAEWLYPGYLVKHHGRTYRVLDVAYRAMQVLAAFEPLETNRSRVIIFSFLPTDYIQILKA